MQIVLLEHAESVLSFRLCLSENYCFRNGRATACAGIRAREEIYTIVYFSELPINFKKLCILSKYEAFFFLFDYSEKYAFL